MTISVIGKKKQVFFSVVTNLWECDEEKFSFLTENNVTVCASLDGPRFVHDRNRPCSSAATGGLQNAGPHERASAWLKRFAEYAARNNTEAPNAICTVTKHSLPYAREIVDEFLSCGLKRVQLGPVDPLGRAAAAWNTIGVSSDENDTFISSNKDPSLSIVDIVRTIGSSFFNVI